MKERKMRRGRPEDRDGETGLSVFSGHKALPSDTCHWAGMESLSAWQEVGAHKHEHKNGVHANTNGQRKWVSFNVCGAGAKTPPASLKDFHLDNYNNLTPLLDVSNTEPVFIL